MPPPIREVASRTKDTMKRKNITTALTLVGTAGLTQAMVVTTGNLLTDGDFEVQSTLPSYSGVVNPNLSNDAGTWGAENGSFVGTTEMVLPIGSRMHAMQASGVTSQTIQIIDLAPYADCIADGNASFNMSAFFNSGNNASGVTAGLIARFFTSDSYNQLMGTSTSFALDSSSRTWEGELLSGAIPTNATFMATEIFFNSNSLAGGTGYVDGASLTVTCVPEPTSALLLSLSGMGLILRRKRS